MLDDSVQTVDPRPMQDRYRSGAIAFHWTMVALVGTVGALGLLHDSWPKETQAFWINAHALAGILLWLTLLARIGYRIRHAPPAPPEGIGALSRRIAGPVHWALCVLMFATPIIGFVTFIYHGRVFDFRECGPRGPDRRIDPPGDAPAPGKPAAPPAVNSVTDSDGDNDGSGGRTLPCNAIAGMHNSH